ncbi:uncharacterized protein LACBIDRAFT_311208 [Laccaria bicolor S238N-H82]|uniref:Predicted protein n=1 Tax=Laccaria bicolor (strain S238N-H82 / ATCC MYA-4686) TaxID=486041 RepID=B0CZG4_LACBS|nr:uncharacterized protein LACBIDRAFT_311208 [Laccaria bicolor S238N-H82]EDR12143.1 predicted protein [Laccaria bicolor S238N-H82]|eukprot:XP_001876407.1 predicted protein [Laccaria bicolor S238N-H82]
MANPARQPCTLVLCFDGTSSQYDEDNTNVVKLFALLKKDDTAEQLCYYQAGIGTWFQPGVVSPLFEWGAKVLDLAFAWYLDAHVLDGYRFIMQNYRSGDKICLFGVQRASNGPFSLRVHSNLYLQGFLGALIPRGRWLVGLLPRDNDSQMPFAYKLYKRTDPAGIQLCAGFKQTYCRNVDVEFVGVWDTVASVGVVMGRTLPFSNANRGIKIFRHALSLDEHRAKFQPNLYHRPGPTDASEDQNLRTGPETGDLTFAAPESSTPDEPQHQASFGYTLSPTGTSFTENKDTGKAYAPVMEEQVIPADVLEVWFSGCHSVPDVGGGAVLNSTLESLANISLRWMVREVIASGCGVIFDPAALAQARIEVSPEPIGLAERELDDIDCLQPIYDDLVIYKIWWMLEVMPLKFTWQDAQCVWHSKHSIHLGKGRNILEPHPNFHVTVQKRMKSALNYKPKATWAAGTEVYVQ